MLTYVENFIEFLKICVIEKGKTVWTLNETIVFLFQPHFNLDLKPWMSICVFLFLDLTFWFPICLKSFFSISFLNIQYTKLSIGWLMHWLRVNKKFVPQNVIKIYNWPLMHWSTFCWCQIRLKLFFLNFLKYSHLISFQATRKTMKTHSGMILRTQTQTKTKITRVWLKENQLNVFLNFRFFLSFRIWWWKRWEKRRRRRRNNVEGSGSELYWLWKTVSPEFFFKIAKRSSNVLARVKRKKQNWNLFLCFVRKSEETNFQIQQKKERKSSEREANLRLITLWLVWKCSPFLLLYNLCWLCAGKLRKRFHVNT